MIAPGEGVKRPPPAAGVARRERDAVVPAVDWTGYRIAGALQTWERILQRRRVQST